MTDTQELQMIREYIKNTSVPTLEELTETNSVTLEEISNSINDFYQRRGLILSDKYLLDQAKKIVNIKSLQRHDIIGKSKIVDFSIKTKDKEEYIITTKKKFSPFRQIKISKDIIGYHLANPIDYPLIEAMNFFNDNLENLKELMRMHNEIKIFKEYDQLPLYLEVNPNSELNHYFSIEEEGLSIQRRNYEIDEYEISIMDSLYDDKNEDIQREYLKRVTVPLSDIKESEGRNIIKNYIRR